MKSMVLYVMYWFIDRLPINSCLIDYLVLLSKLKTLMYLLALHDTGVYITPTNNMNGSHDFRRVCISLIKANKKRACYHVCGVLTRA